MSIQDVLDKCLKQSKYELGMPYEQAFCDHEWSKVTKKIRRCVKCDLKQKSITSWIDLRTKK